MVRQHSDIEHRVSISCENHVILFLQLEAPPQGFSSNKNILSMLIEFIIINDVIIYYLYE